MVPNNNLKSAEKFHINHSLLFNAKKLVMSREKNQNFKNIFVKAFISSIHEYKHPDTNMYIHRKSLNFELIFVTSLLEQIKQYMKCNFSKDEVKVICYTSHVF